MSTKRTRHGDSHTKLYQIWANMRQRCNNPAASSYRWYGAKGVQVCPEWSDWLVFKGWALTSGYFEGLSIDRIDSSGNYEPDNCRWTTLAENASAANVERTQCVNGHEYTEENTYVSPRGYKQCRTCRAEKNRQYEDRHPNRQQGSNR